MTTRNFQIGKTPTVPAPSTGRAAAYVRMSTDQQRYSIANQLKVIRKYAEKREIEIVQVYEDAGKSGLDIEGREALARLFTDILFGKCDFSQILVYDVSRWGRFQDVDESAYYEFLCKRRGVHVVYCAETFNNDGSSLSSLWKNMKRAMAAEYSRELSARTAAAKLHLVSLGFYPGGLCPYGLRRVALDEKRQVRHVVERGFRKSVRSDHIGLVPGPKHEVRTVRDIFRMYAEDRCSASDIARRLNTKRIKSPNGALWTPTTILHMLANTIYIGTLRYNRTSERLRSGRHPNDKARWLTIEGIAKGIVDERTFRLAQKVRLARRKQRLGKSNDELLSELRSYVERHGCVSGVQLLSTRHLSARTTYVKRFGSLGRAYELIGYPKPDSETRWSRALLARQLRTQILDEIQQRIERGGGTVELCDQAHTFRIDNRVEAYLDLSVSRHRYRGHPCWRVRMPTNATADLYVIGLMDCKQPMPFEYYVIPRAMIHRQSFILRGRNTLYEQCRVRSLPAVVEALRGHSLGQGDA